MHTYQAIIQSIAALLQVPISTVHSHYSSTLNTTVLSQRLARRCQPHMPAAQALAYAPYIRSIIHTLTPEL